jgi:Exostosin family
MEVTTGNSTVRDIFIMFKANCVQPDYYSVGKYLRSMLTKALVRTSNNASDLVVACLNTVIGSPGYNEESHSQLLATLFRSVFCPVIPGDSQTSQHLTERYIAGCIPVFVGPPYHTMPFEKEVDYASSAVFLNVTDSAAWLRNDTMEWEFPMIPSGGWDHRLLKLNALDKEAESPKWWFPWIDTKYLINIPTLDDIIPSLRSIPPKVIRHLQRGVQRHRRKFIYSWGTYGQPGAMDIIVDNICHFVGKKCEPHALSN